MNILKRLFTIKKVHDNWYWGYSDREIELGEKLEKQIKDRESKYIQDKLKELNQMK